MAISRSPLTKKVVIECAIFSQKGDKITLQFFLADFWSFLRGAILAQLLQKFTNSETALDLYFLSRNLFVIGQFGQGPL